MKKITFSWFIKSIRPYARNPKIAYRSLIEDLCCSFNHNFGFVESSASSRIMNNEYDVPGALRDVVIKNTFDNNLESSKAFVDGFLNKANFDCLIAELKKYLRNTDVSDAVIESIIEEKNQYKVFAMVLEIAILNDNRSSVGAVLYQSGDNKIKLMSGDLLAIAFNKKVATSDRIVVIPVDSDFTMNLSDSISEDSIHGKWIKRMKKDHVSSKAIKSRTKYVESGVFPTIGKIKKGKTEFYLTPVSKLGYRNKAGSNLDELTAAIDAVVNEYNVSGQGLPLYIPLMGTGRSRVNLSLTESINLIKNRFVNSPSGFYGLVNVVVYHKDAEKLEEWLDDIQNKNIRGS